MLTHIPLSLSHFALLGISHATAGLPVTPDERPLFLAGFHGTMGNLQEGGFP